MCFFYIFHLRKLLFVVDTLIFIPINLNFFGAYHLISFPKDTATFCFHFSLWRILITPELRHLFVQRLKFFDDVKIAFNYRNCWNVWIVYRIYVIKLSFSSYMIFLAHQVFDNVDIFDSVKITFIVVCLH